MTNPTRPNRKPPLIVKIGRAQVPLKIHSQVFRRLLRSTATNCALQFEDQKSMTDEKLRTLTKQFRQALFLMLTTPLAAVRDTEAHHAVDFEFELDINDGHVWEKIKETWNSPTKRRRTPSHNARLMRIRTVSANCKLSILQENIQNLDAIYALQQKIGIPTIGATDNAFNAVASTPLIREAIPWEPSDPDLQVGTNGSFFGYSSLHPTVINNSLAIGGTGSGKSQSLVIPLLNALLRYELHDGTVASLLVIDPKKELLAHVRTTLGQRNELDRLVIIGEGAPIRIFANDSALSVSDKLAKLQVFGPKAHSESDHSYWQNLSNAMLLDLMQLELAFAKQTHGKRLFALMCDELRLPNTWGKGFWQQLRAVLAHSRTSRARLRETDALLRFICRQALVEIRSVQVMQVYTGDDELLRQWTYAVQSADPLIIALSNPDVCQFVDLDPVQKLDGCNTNISDLVVQGKVVVFCPEPREGHRLAAMSLKSKFFEAVFSRENQRRPIGVVADEFQKFVTNDQETGEQSFLDRCRAYRCIAVLATQSISSLKYALGSNAAAQTAVEIVTANTPSRFIFRTTDTDTVAWLKSQLPCASDSGPHVIDLRRPASLRPGEAYYILANGVWGRKRACLESMANNSLTHGTHKGSI